MRLCAYGIGDFAGRLREDSDHMRFTSEEAREAHEDGDPIMVTRLSAVGLIAQHPAGPFTQQVEEFYAECGNIERYDAWAVFSWLGY